MKVRNGFVSNSSSSSFCIFGAIATKEIWHHIKHLAPEDINERVKEDRCSDPYDPYDPADFNDYLYVWSNEYRDCPFTYIHGDSSPGYIGCGKEFDSSYVDNGEIEFAKAKEICKFLGLAPEETKIFYGIVSR
jgi:hypothetical protein